MWLFGVANMLLISICGMNERRIRGFTLPELLVAMVLAGIVILMVFDGINMIRTALPQSDLRSFGEDLLLLQHHELLLETTDSVQISDSARFFRDGVIVETLAR